MSSTKVKEQYQIKILNRFAA